MKPFCVNYENSDQLKQQSRADEWQRIKPWKNHCLYFCIECLCASHFLHFIMHKSVKCVCASLKRIMLSPFYTYLKWLFAWVQVRTILFCVACCAPFDIMVEWNSVVRTRWRRWLCRRRKNAWLCCTHKVVVLTHVMCSSDDVCLCRSYVVMWCVIKSYPFQSDVNCIYDACTVS